MEAGEVHTPNDESFEKKKYFSQHNSTEKYSAHTAKVQCLGWNNCGKKLASGSLDKTLAIFTFDRERFKKDTPLRGHTEGIFQVKWHPSNPELLASVSIDKTLKIWNTNNITSIQTRGENINLAWCPNGETIAIGSKDDIISFIDVRTWNIIHEESFKHEINAMGWDYSNKYFYVTTGSGTVVILVYPEMKHHRTLQAHPSNCISLDFDSYGKYFAVGSADAMVSIWDIEDLVCFKVLPRLDWPVRCLNFSYDGKLIASGSEDLFIDIAHVPSGDQVFELSCTGSTHSLSWHPSKYILAYSCADREPNEKEIGNIRLFGVPHSA